MSMVFVIRGYPEKGQHTEVVPHHGKGGDLPHFDLSVHQHAMGFTQRVPEGDRTVDTAELLRVLMEAGNGEAAEWMAALRVPEPVRRWAWAQYGVISPCERCDKRAVDHPGSPTYEPKAVPDLVEHLTCTGPRGGWAGVDPDTYVQLVPGLVDEHDAAPLEA